MKREFKKGDVIIQIGTMEKMWVYAADRGFYYVTNLRTGVPEVWSTAMEDNFVKLDRMSEDDAQNMANQAKMNLNSQYGIFYNLTIPLAQSM